MKKDKLLYIPMIIGIVLCVLWWISLLGPQDVYMIPVDHMSLSFSMTWSTTKAFSETHDCTYVVNGSYFWRTNSGTFFPAGIRYDSGYTYTWKNKPYDPNLTQTISITQWTKESDFYVDQTGLIISGTQLVIFNAWPSLLRQGEIQTGIQQNISHRDQEFPRTIIAKDHLWNTFFVLFRKPITLYKATQWIKDKALYDAMNLDGGPSTALTDTAHKSNSFNESEVLPILFCIH